MQKQPTALLGCGLLALDVFAPVMHVPLVGAITYLGAGEGFFGWATLAIVAVSFFAILAARFEILWATGVASLALELWVFAHYREAIAKVRDASAQAEGLGGEMLGVLSASMQMQWGWPVLAAGSIALLIAAGLDYDERKAASAGGLTGADS